MKTSRYIGVSRLDGGVGWGVTISIGGVSTWLGSFAEDDEILAGKVYDCYCFFYRFSRDDAIKNLTYIDNGLLTMQERNEILRYGIPEKYQKRVKPVKVLPKGISKRGNKFRICIENSGRRYEKVVDSLDIAIMLLNTKRQEWNI